MRGHVLLVVGVMACGSDVLDSAAVEEAYRYGAADYNDRCTHRPVTTLGRQDGFPGDGMDVCDAGTGAAFPVPFWYSIDPDYDASGFIYVESWAARADAVTRPGLPDDERGIDAVLDVQGSCSTPHAYQITDASGQLLLAGGDQRRWSGFGWSVELRTEDATCAATPCTDHWWNFPEDDGRMCQALPVRFTHHASGVSLDIMGPGVGLIDGFQVVVLDAFVEVEPAERDPGLLWYIRRL